MEQTPTMQKIVQDWARFTINRWKRNLHQLKIGDSGDLMRSFAFMMRGSVTDIQSVLMSYSLQGQFTDMGVGKGQSISAIKGNKEDLRAAGIMGRSEGRHAKKWYSKTMYAETATLAELMQKHFGISGQNAILENLPEKIS